MTQYVQPSRNSIVDAFEVAGVIRDGAVQDSILGTQSPSDLATQHGSINTGALNGFLNSSTTGLDVTFDAGEAFVGGAWLVKDTQTTVTLADNTSNQTIYVGWDESNSETVIVGPSSSFASVDQKTSIYTFDTSGGSVTSTTDERILDQAFHVFDDGSVTLDYNALIRNSVATNSSLNSDGRQVFLCDTSSSAITVTLDTEDNREANEVTIVDVGGNAGTNNITIDTAGAGTIGGSTSITISANDGARQLVSDGTDWHVVGSTVSGGGGTSYTDEDAQDAVGTIMQGSTNTSVVYDDAANTITIEYTGSGTGNGIGDVLAAGDFAVVSTGGGFQVIDGDSTNPFSAALDAAANGGGGNVYFPPRTITETGPVYWNEKVNVYATWGESRLQITGAGTDGLVFRNTDTVTQAGIDVRWTRLVGGLTIEMQGPSGNCGRAVVDNDSRGRLIDGLRITETNNVAWWQEFDAYENHVQYMLLDRIDCGNRDACIVVENGAYSAPQKFGTLACYPEDLGSGSLSKVVQSNGGGNLHFDIMNLGQNGLGPIFSGVINQFFVRAVNWEAEHNQTLSEPLFTFNTSNNSTVQSLEFQDPGDSTPASVPYIYDIAGTRAGYLTDYARDQNINVINTTALDSSDPEHHVICAFDSSEITNYNSANKVIPLGNVS